MDLKIFAKTYDNAVLNQIYNILDTGMFDNKKIRIMPDCLTEDTEVLTTNGFKLIKDITKDDLIANYDSNSKKIIFNNVKNVIIRDKRDDEKVYRYYNKQSNISITVSENHRMAIKNKMGVTAKNIESFNIKDICFSADGVDNIITNKYTDNDIRLIAWIVGDGSIKITHNSKSDNYRIRFEVKKQRKYNRIIELLMQENLVYKATITKRNTFKIIINTESSKKYLELLSYKKIYPSDFIFLNKNQAEIFINEAIMVNGDYEQFIKTKSYRFNSVKKEEIDIFNIIFSLNMGSSYIHRTISKNIYLNNKEHIMYYVNCIPNYKLEYNKNGLHNRKFIREEIEYNKKLVCLECDTSYFVVRQKGVTFITGNCHVGIGCVIGFTSELDGKIDPNIVGVDLGCGVNVVKFDKNVELKYSDIDNYIREFIPCGKSTYIDTNSSREDIVMNLISKLNCFKSLHDVDRIINSYGTLGGGNHFIEIDTDEDDYKYLVIHTGSRNLGVQIAKYYYNMMVAGDIKSIKTKMAKEMNEIILKFKKQNRTKEIPEKINEIRNKYNKTMCKKKYLENDEYDKYMNDISIAQEYAVGNRKIISDSIINKFNLCKYELEQFESIHNYVDITNNIVRKGAISANKNEKLIIPINMADGSIIGIGKGNEDWNYSAPHGAGRLMSRNEAKINIDIFDYVKSMKGIYTTSVCSETLDESPMAYRSIEEIKETIVDSVDIINIIKPVYNFKSVE